METHLMARGRHHLARYRKIASREHGSRKSTTYEEINAVEIRSVCGEERLEVSLKHSHQVTEDFAVLHHLPKVEFELGENVSRPTNYPK